MSEERLLAARATDRAATTDRATAQGNNGRAIRARPTAVPATASPTALGTATARAARGPKVPKEPVRAPGTARAAKMPVRAPGTAQATAAATAVAGKATARGRGERLRPRSWPDLSYRVCASAGDAHAGVLPLTDAAHRAHARSAGSRRAGHRGRLVSMRAPALSRTGTSEVSHELHESGHVGSAGLEGLPRHDGVRQRERSALGDRRGRRRADRPGRRRGRRHLLRHRRHLFGRGQRGGDGQAGAEVPDPGRGGDRHQGLHAGDARARTAAGSGASTSSRASTPRCAASTWTTSTSTRSTDGTPGRPSRRRWRRCTTSCGRARPATSAPAACSPGSSPRPSTRPRRTAGRSSSRCRTTTTSSTARRSAR